MKKNLMLMAAFAVALLTASCSGNVKSEDNKEGQDSLCCAEADSTVACAETSATVEGAEATDAPAAEGELNPDLFGVWMAGDGETQGFDLELYKAPRKDEEGRGMNYGFARSVIFFEYGPLYIFRSLEADGDNIKVQCDIIENVIVSGDPDSYDEDAAVYEERRSKGTLVIKPAGAGKLKVDVNDDGIKPYTAHKVK